jgi:carboxymethylenebutenolidase
VAAPDFYHRTAPGVALGSDEAGRQEGFRLLKQMQRSDVLADVKATMNVLRNRSETTPKVGIVGFSVGGHIAYLAATRLDIAIAISFYGGWITTGDIPMSQPEPTVALTPGIAERGGRILYLVGERDHLVTRPQTDELELALRTAGVRHELVVYPGIRHGFFCNERDNFDEAARDDAWRRVTSLLAEELKH